MEATRAPFGTKAPLKALQQVNIVCYVQKDLFILLCLKRANKGSRTRDKIEIGVHGRGVLMKKKRLFKPRHAEVCPMKMALPQLGVS